MAGAPVTKPIARLKRQSHPIKLPISKVVELLIRAFSYPDPWSLVQAQSLPVFVFKLRDSLVIPD